MSGRADAVRGATAGACAGLAAAAAMYVLSAVAGTRTLPAVLSEPLLGVLPGPVFGLLIDRLQHLGKILEEAALILLMVAALAALGAATAVLRARRSGAHLGLAAGAVAWLVVVLIVLPIGGGGPLGLTGGLAVPVAWAVVFAIYAFVLEMGLGGGRPHPVDEERRRLIGAAPLAIAALSLGLLAVRLVPGWARTLARPAEAGRGLSPEITAAGDFYVVSKNFSDPVLDAGHWSLNVRGLVAAPYRLSYADFRGLPATAVLTTLECISNVVGGTQISTGEFAGVRLADLVQRAQSSAQARFVNFRSHDGYTESLPLDLALSDPDILVAHTLDGAPLAPEHGFPARVLVPGRYGMKGPKWLEDVELASTALNGYWEGEGWDRMAVVKTMSRIDTPAGGSIVSGHLTVGGVAFAGTRGVSRVEVSTDGGRTWSDAVLRPPRSPLTWVLWTFDWSPPSGEHTLVVRATDGRGDVQSPDERPSFPAGSSGYHRVSFSAGH